MVSKGISIFIREVLIMATKKHTVKKSAKVQKVSGNGSSEDYGPMVVKIISIFGYIAAGFGILVGLIMLFGGQFIVSMMPLANIPDVTAAMLGVIITVVAIIMILVSVFGFFLAKGLWDHKNWARIIAIVFSVIGVLGGLTSLPSGIVGIVLHGAVLYFLAFDSNVKKLFV
jgi:hypothetical protein